MPTPIKEYVRPLSEWVMSGAIPPVVNLDGSLYHQWPGLVFVSGSANHPLISHSSGYIRERTGAQNGTRSRDYLLVRVKAELRGGLWWTEPLVVTYGGVTLAPWSIVWWTAWVTGDDEMTQLVGAWIERSLVLIAMHTRVGHGGELEIYAPGARRDAGGSRKTLAAQVAVLLGYKSKLDDSPKHDWSGGLALRAMRHADRLHEAAARVRRMCRAIIDEKALVTGNEWHRKLRLMVPLRWHLYETGWVSYFLPDNQHKLAPQDPAQLLGGWIYDHAIEAWPFTDGDPRETGWGHIVQESQNVLCTWTNRGVAVRSVPITLPNPLATIDIGPQSTGNELDDLPPVPAHVPDPPKTKVRGGSAAPSTPAKPEPEAPANDERRAELLDLRNRLLRQRDHAEEQEDRQTAHKALVELNRRGAWDGLGDG